MSQMVLPNSINYAEQLPSLMPGVNNYTQILNPVNGSKFDVIGQQIIIDFPSSGTFIFLLLLMNSCHLLA